MSEMTREAPCAVCGHDADHPLHEGLLDKAIAPIVTRAGHAYRPKSPETPREIFEALLLEWAVNRTLDPTERETPDRIMRERYEWLARFDAAGAIATPTVRGSEVLRAFELWKQGERSSAALALAKLGDDSVAVAFLDMVREWTGRGDFAGEFDAVRVAMRGARLQLAQPEPPK